MLKLAWQLILGWFAITLAACADFGPITLDLGPCWLDCPYSDPPVSFALSPRDEHILRGDTTAFFTWQCSGGSTCGQSGNVSSRWSIDGSAGVFVIGPDGVATGVSAAERVLVRGIDTGRVSITAVARGDSSKFKTASLTVADSSVITSIALNWVYGSDTVPLGANVVIFASLLDSARTAYRAQPSTWAVSDTSVLTLAPGTFLDGRPTRIVRTRKPGTVTVTATFLELSATRQLTVVP